MRRLILALAGLILVGGCSTAPLLQFTSCDPGLRSSPVARDLAPTSDSIRIDAQYDRIDGALMLFSFEIWNLTRRELEVDPAGFQYRVERADGPVAGPAGSVHAEDPEWSIAELDQRTSWAKASAPRPPGEPSGLQLIVDLLDLLTAGSRTDAEERDRELLRLKQAEEDREARAEHERHMEHLARERDELVHERMRSTRLPSGERLTGRVAFPAAPLYSALRDIEVQGHGFAKVGAPPDQPTAALVLVCPIGGELRERRFSIRHY